jgi:ATP-dependent DNA helicase RecQ
MARDALRADEFGGLSFGPAARPILKGEERVPVIVPPKRERRRRDRAGAEDHPHDPLFEALRAVRRDLAKDQGVPPYVIFHDATLREMAARKPATRAALGTITGVGQKKLDAYGQPFLDAIRNYG